MFDLKCHQEPCSKVGSLSLAEHFVGFEPGTFRFSLQHIKPFFLDWNINSLPDHTSFNVLSVLTQHHKWLFALVDHSEASLLN